MAETKAKTSDENPNKGRSINDLEAELTKLREDIASLTDTMKGIASDQYDTARARVNARSKEARKQAEDAIAGLRPVVEQNPITSMLVLIGLGFLIGSMMRR